MRINLRKEAKNIWGPSLKRAREQSPLKLKQVDMAELLTSMGLSMDRSAVSRIENQKRAITDIELHYFIHALRINYFRLAELLRMQPNVVPDYEDFREDGFETNIKVAEDDPDLGW